ncbi:junctional adhesion molecule-like [Labeo rohita]|uniref:junctional adhesion molecule-like n=1 Tax=Labeo rohita TaxID=84645 RepID=UPI0021E23C71|nr:junctional adhesion molecule-like [Labeo rohita]
MVSRDWKRDKPGKEHERKWSVRARNQKGLAVHGPSGPLVAPLGTSVVLPCYVDELLSVDGLEVEWRRTDSETLVHLFEDNDSRAEAQHQDYQDRAHFFTEHIKDGNFSLRLDNLRAEDEGVYTCKVHCQLESGEIEVQIKHVERLLVSGSDQSISVSVGQDVTLNCSVNSHIKPEDIEEVSWKKTDEDEEHILVLLYQNNKTFSDSSDKRYRDRVEFFTAEIPKGNFSVHLKSVRTEDKGVYMCQVFAGEASANATVVMVQLGFSVLHIMVLILCVAASGSALLLCGLIYCTSQNKDYTCKTSVYLFGSVSIVLVTSIVMVTELILKRINGRRSVWDLRIIVFPSETIFVLFGMAAQIVKYYKTATRSEPTIQNTAEAHETEALSGVDSLDLCESVTLSKSTLKESQHHMETSFGPGLESNNVV